MTKKEKIKYERWVTSYRESARKHFLKRFKDRLGYEAPDFMVGGLTAFFKGKKPEVTIEIKDTRSSTLRGPHPKRRKWYLLDVSTQEQKHHKFWCLWDKSALTLVTVLPPDEEPNCDPTDLSDAISNEFYAQFEEVE